MNKNEQTATMYETIPAVAELNKVPGFNPLKLLRRIISPENGEEMMQLDLRYKKLWFRLANPKGRIRLNALRITEQIAIYEAQIFLERTDENPIGSFTSSCTKEEAPGGRYIQAAQQTAMDEALSDAGFGIQFADVGVGADGNRYGSRIPVNGGLSAKMQGGAASAPAETPKQVTAPSGSTIRNFPAAAEKADTLVQEKPSPASGLPVQGGKETASGGAGSLPANPGNGFESLPAQDDKGQRATGQPLDSAGKTAGQLAVKPDETAKAGGDTGTAQARVQEAAGNNRLPAGAQADIQENIQTAGTGELPVKASEPESLPVQADTRTSAEEKTGDILPVSEKEDGEEDTRKAVQGMMALLGGQNVSEKAAASPGPNMGSAENAGTGGQASEVQSLPVTGEPAQEKADVRYTPDMPVEEIVKLMTFEEAGKVVVDTGVCKGQTIAEVAERRPPSLKFYLYGGYRGDNNILRAAAQIMLDSLAVKKAG